MRSSTPFGSPQEVYKWIEGFINMERDLNSRPMKLEAMKELAKAAGNPERSAPAVHVAGSKGKGSVSAMTAAMLKSAGYKTARYASPHVRDFRERITLGNNFFDGETYRAAGNILRETAERCIASGAAPTFFELFTLWFFLCSRVSGCDAMALETGLGGRLDATNIVDPAVSVITVIEKEHTEILGGTIEKIAAEKAGIIKAGRPVILAGQKSEALEVFREKAGEKGSPLFYFPELCELSGVEFDGGGSTFDLKINLPREKTKLKKLRVSTPGEVQVKNAALAVLAVKTAFPDTGEKAIREGLEAFSLPARFEKIRGDPVFVVDGAHTALSVGETVKTFTKLYGSGGILLFGCAAGKDVESMAENAVPFFSTIVITAPGTFKKSFPADVYGIFSRSGGGKKNGPAIFLVPETHAAVAFTKALAERSRLPVLGAGSFYLAAEIIKGLEGR